MKATEILNRLSLEGIQLEAYGNNIRHWPSDRMTDDLAAQVTSHKSDLLGVLRGGFTQVVQLGGREYRFSLWQGQKLPDQLLAYDTETELIQERKIPQMALATVYGSSGSCFLIHPQDLAKFVRLHSKAHWVCHNAAFDFWVTQQHLGGGSAESAWWDIVSEGRMCCTMILDQLIRLAKFDDEPVNKGLAYLASTACGINLDKDDPYRMRYGELIGMSVDQWRNVEAGFWQYACKDPVATLLVCQKQLKLATQLIEPHQSELLPESVSRFGPLTACLQTQGAIALEAVSRRGIRIDKKYAKRVHSDISELVSGLVTELEDMVGEEVFRRKARTEEISLTPAGAPRRNAKLIKGVLERIASSADPVVVPTINKDGLVTDSVKFWQEHTDVDPIVGTYVRFMEQTKLMQFFRALEDERIYPKYKPMVRTGRTSCSNPNISSVY